MKLIATAKQSLQTAIITGLLITTTSVSYASTLDDIKRNTQVTAINTGNTAENTEDSVYYLDKILTVLTNALFGKVVDMGDYMSAFVAVAPATSNGYQQATDMLNTLEGGYMGNDDGTTLPENYQNYLDSFILDPNISNFPTQYTNSSNLFNNPAEGFSYSDDQEKNVLRYIANLGGTTTSILRDPTTGWQSVSSDDFTTASNIMKYNSRYATLSSIYSMSNNNLTYIAGERMGIDMAGAFTDYNSSSISSIGIIRYIQNHMVGREEWWENLSVEPFSSAIKEGVTLTAGIFVVLVKSYELLERLVATQSALITLELMNTQTETQNLMNDITNAS